MDKRTLSIFLLLFAAAAAYAQYPSAEYAIKEAWWRIDALTKCRVQQLMS